MFMTIFSGARFPYTDPDQERDPPPAAAPLSFPTYIPSFSTTAWSQPSLQSLFSRIQKPSDISSAHVDALNVQVSAPCSPDALLPLDSDGASYFLPLVPRRPLSHRLEEFYKIRSELEIDNDAGYRAVGRATKSGVRLIYFGKFWSGLEAMSRYWDTGLDQYYEPVQQSPIVSPESIKRQRLDSAQPNNLTVPDLDELGHHLHTEDSRNAVTPEETHNRASWAPAPHPDKESQGHALGTTSATSDPKKGTRYKGRRFGSGREMPDRFRTDTVKALVKGVVEKFLCSVEAPRKTPIVQMNRLNLPVRKSAAVYRVPNEQAKARSGCVEGPIMTIQVRPETEFDCETMTDQVKMDKSRLDLLQELGGLIQCAQERNRQGKTETRAGEGKWWTEKPRWGGGPGDEGENRESSGDIEAKDMLQAAESAPRMMRPSTREAWIKDKVEKLATARRNSPAMLWREIRCGSKLWDPTIDYQAIGKPSGSDYDEVFLVSSINHHVSIVKLTVHTAYINYIQHEQPPDPVPAESDWCSPRLQRTEWFDLFDKKQRIQVFHALWAVTAYLTRSPHSTKETEIQT